MRRHKVNYLKEGSSTSSNPEFIDLKGYKLRSTIDRKLLDSIIPSDEQLFKVKKKMRTRIDQYLPQTSIEIE